LEYCVYFNLFLVGRGGFCSLIDRRRVLSKYLFYHFEFPGASFGRRVGFSPTVSLSTTAVRAERRFLSYRFPFLHRRSVGETASLLPFPLPTPPFGRRDCFSPTVSPSYTAVRAERQFLSYRAPFLDRIPGVKRSLPSPHPFFSA
jgi:hypothetical protein